MFTRQEKLDQQCTYREYYAQFVTEAEKAAVIKWIGLELILDSQDPHFNNIDLVKWDTLPDSYVMAKKLRECGDYLTLSGKVCIYKEAARQIKEAHLTQRKETD